LWEAKVKYGSESAAANVLEVEEDEAEECVFIVVGDAGTPELPTAPDTV
jgi:hypothetical protein